LFLMNFFIYLRLDFQKIKYQLLQEHVVNRSKINTTSSVK